MKCSSCGGENNNASTNCVNCGVKLGSSKSLRYYLLVFFAASVAGSGYYAYALNKEAEIRQKNEQIILEKRNAEAKIKESLDKAFDATKVDARIAMNDLAVKSVQAANQIADVEKNKGYDATLTCGYNGSHTNIMACFLAGGAKTELEITTNGQYHMYQYDIQQAGREDGRGLHIQLGRNFQIKAQNSHDVLRLGLVIVNSDGKVMYEKQVGQYGVINIRN